MPGASCICTYSVRDCRILPRILRQSMRRLVQLSYDCTHPGSVRHPRTRPGCCNGLSECFTTGSTSCTGMSPTIPPLPPLCHSPLPLRDLQESLRHTGHLLEDRFTLHEIANLLCQKELPLSEIAAGMNFSSFSYFSRYVSRHFGISHTMSTGSH